MSLFLWGRGFAALFLFAGVGVPRAARVTRDASVVQGDDDDGWQSVGSKPRGRRQYQPPVATARTGRQHQSAFPAAQTVRSTTVAPPVSTAHLVAARSPFATYVWEVVVSRNGSISTARGELLQRFKFPGNRSKVYSFVLLPGTSELVGSTSETNTSFFWDARTGKELRRIADARVYDFSPGGHHAVGFAPKASAFNLWLARSWPRVIYSQTAPNLDFAVFSPSGDRYAAVLRYSDDGAKDEHCSVGAWDAGTGVLISMAPHVHNVLSDQQALAAAFDGNYLMLCRGSHARHALCFNFVGNSGCLDGKFEIPTACDDATAATGAGGNFMSGGLLISTGDATANIWKMSPDGVSPVHRVRFGAVNVSSRGVFSPDGRKALIISRTWSTYPKIRRAYIWAFADGKAPVEIAEGMNEDPVWSATSESVLAIVDDRSAVAIWDLTGSLQLRLTAPDMPNLRGMAAGDCCGW